ncbi:MAG: Nif3-like dinuclear metal center hexameric protein [Oscillospiraceae bacterium]|nr:Nif3-like dinuclear metal center hexameric protein [Oscillospiraceae bacterium]
MRTVEEIYLKLDQIAPFRHAASYDNCGVLVGDAEAKVTKAVVTLDISLDVVEEAKRKGANLIISHHPVIFDPLKAVTKQNSPAVYEMVKNGINAVCAHTNFDLAEGGTNDILFEMLDLTEPKPLGPTSPVTQLSLGRIGKLERFMSPIEFVNYVKKSLFVGGVRFTLGSRSIKNVAICGGSGGSLYEIAHDSDVDAFVTGDVKHDIFVKAQNDGFTLVDAGHFSTEAGFIDVIIEKLSKSFGDLAFARAEACVNPVKYL